MRILVTGIAGFIGFHVAKKLTKAGHSLIGIDNLNHYYDVNLKINRLKQLGIRLPEGTKRKSFSETLPIDFLAHNLEDKNWFSELHNENIDVIINLAAQAGVGYSLINPDVYIDSNITGFLNVLEFARKVKPKHVVFASSSSVYGLNNEIPFKETQNTDHPISLYAATKKSNEMMAHTYSHIYNIPCTGLRFFTVYGPWGRPDMALYKFTKRIINGEAIELYNNGDMHRDFTYIDDIVDGIEKVIPKVPKKNKHYDHNNPKPNLSSAPYRILNIGNNKPENLERYVLVLENCIGKKAKILYKPLQPGDVYKTYANTEMLNHLTGYSPKTSIEKGIPQFVDWYKSYYK